MLGISGSLLIVSLLLVRFSFAYVLVSIGVGLVDAVISIDELTGGKMLSWLSIPLFIVGQVVAAYVAGWDPDSFGLIIQFFLVVCCFDLLAVLVFRRQIERFVNRKNSTN